MASRLGRKFVPALGGILKSFTPFHTVIKWFLGQDFEETYSASGNQIIFADVYLNDTGEEFQQSFTTSAFPGTAGTGIYSGIIGGTFNPKQGRYLPSATLTDDGYFWSSTSTVTKEVPNAPRNVGRRRNLRYLLPSGPMQRGGKAQPFGADFMVQNALYGQDYSGFIPKGFSFSGQNFKSTKGEFSGVYLYELNDTYTYEGLVASSFFPARAIPPFTDIDNFGVDTLSSLPAYRDFFGANIRRTILRYLLRKGQEDRRYWNFSEENLQNFRFGKGLLQMFKEYVVDFEKSLRNAVENKYKYEGGYNVIAHAFGPLLFNHDNKFAGRIEDESNKLAFEGIGAETISGEYPQWSAIAHTQAAKGEIYAKEDKQEFTLTEPNLSLESYGAYANIMDILEFPNRTIYSNDTLLSGVTFLGTNTNSFAVINNENSPYNADFAKDDGITFFKRPRSNDPFDGIVVRYPIDGYRNRFINGDLQLPATDGVSVADDSLSAIAAWGLRDKNRTPGFAKFGSPAAGTGEIEVITENQLTPSSVRVAEFTFSGGETSGVGTKTNPTLYTIASPRVTDFPRNPDRFTAFEDHRLTLEASANSTDWTPYFGVINTSRRLAWNYLTSSWDSIVGVDTSAYPLTPMSLSGSQTQNTTEYQTWVYDMNLSANTGNKDYTADQVSFFIHPVTTGSTATARIKNLQLTNRMPKRNRLRPEKNYRGQIVGRVARTFVRSVPETLFLRIRTQYRPLVGYGYESQQRSFCWNFKNNFWEDINSKDTDQWFALNMTPDNQSVSGTFYFSTKNDRTDLKYKSLAATEYYDLAGPVHDKNTAYYVEIAKPYYTDDLAAATLESVSIVDMEYEQAVDGYEKEDLFPLFEYFDDLSVGSHSRDAFNSSGTFYTSGGSRSEGMEWFGGSHSAVDGIYTFEENR